MDLNKPVDLEQFHEELSIMRHLERMDPSLHPKKTEKQESEESNK